MRSFGGCDEGAVPFTRALGVSEVEGAFVFEGRFAFEAAVAFMSAEAAELMVLRAHAYSPVSWLAVSPSHQAARRLREVAARIHKINSINMYF